ncbi:2-oxoacid:acceptor oxidoreductase family protein [Chloroflexota bacterium]
MKEIRWHGRGGQGAVVGARVLAASIIKEGKSAVALPKFGAERRGAPVVAYNKLDDAPIREKTQVYYPDCLVVIDPRLMRSVNVFEGIKEDSILVLDSSEIKISQYHKNLRLVGVVDGTRIALEEIGRQITNICMLGAFARTTGWVQLDSILSSLGEYFSGTVLQKNIKCAQRGYEETKIIRF